MNTLFWFIVIALTTTALIVITVTYFQRCSCRKYRLGWDSRIVDEDEDGIERLHSREVCQE